LEDVLGSLTQKRRGGPMPGEGDDPMERLRKKEKRRRHYLREFHDPRVMRKKRLKSSKGKRFFYRRKEKRGLGLSS